MKCSFFVLLSAIKKLFQLMKIT